MESVKRVADPLAKYKAEQEEYAAALADGIPGNGPVRHLNSRAVNLNIQASDETLEHTSLLRCKSPPLPFAFELGTF